MCLCQSVPVCYGSYERVQAVRARVFLAWWTQSKNLALKISLATFLQLHIASISVAQWPAKSWQNDFAKYHLTLSVGLAELRESGGYWIPHFFTLIEARPSSFNKLLLILPPPPTIFLSSAIPILDWHIQKSVFVQNSHNVGLLIWIKKHKFDRNKIWQKQNKEMKSVLKRYELVQW